MTIRTFFLHRGQVFGRWTVIKEASRRNYRSEYQCRCSCGTVKDVDGINLRKGLTKSCGCLNSEVVTQRNRTHGQSKTAEYQAWSGAKKRCYNKKAKSYEVYGARGIHMSDEWLDDFAQFIADMGPCPKGYTLERRNVDGPYSAENCRWATRGEQNVNTRRNKWLTFDGLTLTYSQWSRKLGLGPSVITRRLKRGWSIERTLTP